MGAFGHLLVVLGVGAGGLVAAVAVAEVFGVGTVVATAVAEDFGTGAGAALLGTGTELGSSSTFGGWVEQAAEIVPMVTMNEVEKYCFMMGCLCGKSFGAASTTMGRRLSIESIADLQCLLSRTVGRHWRQMLCDRTGAH